MTTSECNFLLSLGYRSLFHYPFPQPPQERRGRLRFEYYHPSLILAGINAGASLQLGKHLAFFLRNAKMNPLRTISLKHGIDTFEQSAQLDPFRYRNVDSAIIIS